MKKFCIPPESILIASKYDYFDVFSIPIHNYNIPIEAIAKSFFESAPPTLRKLLRLRNKIVSLFGLKTGTKVKDEVAYLNSLPMNVDDVIGLFQVMEKSENEIIFGADDTHLDFRVSLLKSMQNLQPQLTMTTIVKYHNAKGRFYFKLVGPFHRKIAPDMLFDIATLLRTKN